MVTRAASVRFCAVVALLVLMTREADADGPKTEGEQVSVEDTADVERELVARNAARQSELQKKAAEEHRKMVQLVEQSEMQGLELAAHDEKTQAAVRMEESRIARKTLGVWSVIGGGAVALAGFGFYAAALSNRSSIETGTLANGAEIGAARDRTQTFGAVGGVLVGVSAVALVAGVVLVLTARQPTETGLPRATSHARVDLTRGQVSW